MNDDEQKFVSKILEHHDLRRWNRCVDTSGKFLRLECYCGKKIYEDSNEAMFGHVASILVAAIAKGKP